MSALPLARRRRPSRQADGGATSASGDAVTAGETSVSQLLRLNGLGARLLLAIYLLLQVVLIVSNLEVVTLVWPSVAGLLVVATAGALLCSAPGDPFPSRYTAVVVASAPVTTALVVWQLPDTGAPGYAGWNFGAVMWLMFVLSLRGRIVWAWVGFAMMVAVTVIWCVDVGRPLTDAVDLTVRQAATLVVSAVFGAALRSTSRRIVVFQRAEQARSAVVAAARATRDSRQSNGARLQQLAGPILEQIAGATVIGDDLRRRAGLLEAELRDSIRATALYREPLITAARAARGRGVDVVLLDDSAPTVLSTQDASAIATRMADELSRLSRGSFTGRMLPAGRTPAATILIDDGGDDGDGGSGDVGDGGDRLIELP